MKPKPKVDPIEEIMQRARMTALTHRAKSRRFEVHNNLKRELGQLALPATEYEAAIKRLAEALRI